MKGSMMLLDIARQSVPTQSLVIADSLSPQNEVALWMFEDMTRLALLLYIGMYNILSLRHEHARLFAC